VIQTRPAKAIAAATLALALPLIFVGASLDLLVNSGWLYSYNWWRNDIPARTAIAKPELDRAARTIKAYFDTPQSEFLLDVQVNSGGRDVRIYTDREILHMRDVKTLLRGFLSAGLWAGVAAAVTCVAYFLVLGRRFWPLLASAVRWSAVVTVAAVVIIGAASVINFGAVFTLFHELGFTNQLWQLNSGDYLLLMFPERFWFEATLILGAMIVAQFALALLLTRWFAKRAAAVA
jgi:integral membrane protein (TIGR01906 family)